jgi:serine/threonine protein kinase
MGDMQGHMVLRTAELEQIRHGTYEATYELIALLNEGGNAKVCRCWKKDTGEEYAIKILNTGKQGEKLSRFANEIAVMQTHGGVEKGVLPIIDADAEDGWYVMPIATRIEKYFDETKAGIKEKVAAIVELAKALEALHVKGITHRDIKPDNLFRYEDRYCFGDFGLCEYPEGEKVATRTDKQLGAFNTIAPEMYKNPQGQDGTKADVYSLAKTMWILLTGDAKGFTGPYSSEDSVNAFANYKHLKDEQLALIEFVSSDTRDMVRRECVRGKVF